MWNTLTYASLIMNILLWPIDMYVWYNYEILIILSYNGCNMCQRDSISSFTIPLQSIYVICTCDSIVAFNYFVVEIYLIVASF